MPSSESIAMPLIKPRPLPANFVNAPVARSRNPISGGTMNGERAMPEDHLVVLAVEGYDGSDFEVEIGVGNFIAWSEGIRRHIGRENGVVAVAAEVKSEDGDFRSSDVCLDLVNGLFAAERRRPGARNHIAGEGIQHAVG